MKKTLLILLTAFALSPFIFGHIVLQEKNSGMVTEPIPSLSEYSTPVATSPLVVIEKPEKLIIPSINVEADMENVGLDNEGRMDVPKNDDNVAWWSLGIKPGEAGNAVLAGHFDRKDGGPAVFYSLKDLKAGDKVEIVDEKGKTLTFEVYKNEIFKDSTFPIELVFGTTNERNLNLITCDGVFDQEAKNYSDRLVVFTRLVDSIRS